MSKEILCRIDPEDMFKKWTIRPNGSQVFVQNYITTHAVPENCTDKLETGEMVLGGPHSRRVELTNDDIDCQLNPSPVLFAGEEEVAECIFQKTAYEKLPRETCHRIAKELLNIFGIQWDKAPEWAEVAKVYFIDSKSTRNTVLAEIPRPAPNLEYQRKKALEALQSADSETLRKVLEVLG